MPKGGRIKVLHRETLDEKIVTQSELNDLLAKAADKKKKPDFRVDIQVWVNGQDKKAGLFYQLKSVVM